MSDPLPAGTVIADRYTLRSVLTSGAHVGRYRADAAWGSAVTLTLFTPPHADTPTGARVRQAFLRYARLLAQVQHPGIPRVTDLIETPERIVVVQEDRLHRPLGRGVLPPGQAEDLTRRLFGALAAAHAQALLHTRLTPEQVWLDAQEQPVLAGFGLAERALREAGQAPTPDPRYAAPEVLAGGAPTPQADVYALAATLLEVVTGHAPPPASARRQGVPLPPLPPGTRPAVREALTRALHLEPAERAVGAAEVLEGMDRAVEALPELALPEPAAPEPVLPSAPVNQPLPPRPRRSPSLGPALAVVGALALGGALAALRLGGAGTVADAPAPPTSTAVRAEAGPAPAEAIATAVPPEPAPPPEPVVLRTDVVSALQLNLRATPSAAGAVLGTLARGERLDVLAEQGGWLHVRGNSSQDGWVSAQHTLPLLDEERTQAALERMSAGGAVQLERGVYWFHQPVQLTATVDVTGAGQQATLLMSDAAEDTLVLRGADVNLTGLGVVHVGNVPARALLQEGGTLTARRITLSGAVRDADEEEYGSGLWVKDDGQASLQGSRLEGNAFGLYVSDASRVEVGESSLSGNAESGALFKNDATGVVRGSTIAMNGVHGVQVFGQATPQLQDNRIRRNRGRGVTIYGQSSPTITGNTIEENTLQGVGIQEEAHPTLKGNTIQGNRQSGMTFFDNSGGTVERNTVRANLKTGVAVSEYAEPSLLGNTIARNRENGLSYADSSGGTAQDNVISGNGNPGIAAWGDAQPALTGNLIQDNQQSGVVLAERSSGEVRSNTISGNALYGLIVTGDASPSVVDNTVTGNARGGIFYKQNAGGSGSGNSCSGNGGPDLSASLNPDQPGPDFSADGCTLY